MSDPRLGMALARFRQPALRPGIYEVPNNDISAAFTSTSGWVWDATRGYYNNATWNAEHDLILPNITQAKQITATFTGYYNSPSNCLGQSQIKVILSDGSELKMGTQDSWSISSVGQTIYKGDAGIEEEVTRNVVEETYTITVPDGVTVQSIKVLSSRLSGYNASNRGVKDIRIDF